MWLGVDLVGHMVILCLTMWGATRQFFQSGVKLPLVESKLLSIIYQSPPDLPAHLSIPASVTLFTSLSPLGPSNFWWPFKGTGTCTRSFPPLPGPFALIGPLWNPPTCNLNEISLCPSLFNNYLHDAHLIPLNDGSRGALKILRLWFLIIVNQGSCAQIEI